jgi:hypothetical protein
LLPSLDTGTKWNNHHFSQSQNVAKKAATQDNQGNHQKDRIIKDVILSFVSFPLSPTYLLEFLTVLSSDGTLFAPQNGKWRVQTTNRQRIASRLARARLSGNPCIRPNDAHQPFRVKSVKE